MLCPEVKATDADGGDSRFAVLSMAPAIEKAAFDLYRTVAGRCAAPAAPQTFIGLAQAEKADMGVRSGWLGSLGQLPPGPHKERML